MGILDALVIDEQYRDQVLEADPGCADKYLFVPPRVRDSKSLLDFLDLDESVEDLFANQRITGILNGIAYGAGETAAAKRPAAGNMEAGKNLSAKQSAAGNMTAGKNLSEKQPAEEENGIRGKPAGAGIFGFGGI